MVAKTRVAVACVMCGKLVERTPSQLAKVKLVHCSNACSWANPARTRRKEYLTCEWCEESFYPNPHPAAANRFCSKACKKAQMAAGKRVQAERADKGIRKDGTILVECFRCGNPVFVPPYRQKAEQHYCSKECFNALGAQVNGRKSSHLYRRLNKRGQPYQPRPTYREAMTSDGIKGGGLSREGYVFLHWPEHPSAGGRGRVMHHRVVMEEMLGRRLVKGETVHHADGNRENNDPSNLMLMVSDHPQGAAIEDLIKAYEKRLREMRADLRKLKAGSAPTSMVESVHYSPDDPARELTLFETA